MAHFFEWKEEYNLDIKEIDDQHRFFVSLLDGIYKALLDNEQRDTVAIKLEDLKNYAVNHFATEEKYFDEFKFPGADEHKAAHKELKEKVLDFQAKFKAGEAEVSFELIDFLEDWLIDHLANMDRKYADFFHKHGLK